MAAALPRIRISWLTVGAAGVALLVAMPMLVVVLNLLVPRGDTWAHLASTVLPGYLWNTLLLALGVGAGVALVGVSCAWLTSLCRFPANPTYVRID